MLLANYLSLQIRLQETALTPKESYCYNEYKSCLTEKNIIYEHCRQELYYCREFGEFRIPLFLQKKKTVTQKEETKIFTEYENLVNERFCLNQGSKSRVIFSGYSQDILRIFCSRRKKIPERPLPFLRCIGASGIFFAL